MHNNFTETKKGKGYPKSFWLMCVTIVWERFAYHGISTLLVLYFTAQVIQGGIGLSVKEATALYGTFVGILHLTPLIGGWLADSYLGQQKSVILGGTFVALGDIILYCSPVKEVLYLGLVCIIIGNGFFKASGSSLIGNIFSNEEPNKKEVAYSIFYMFINLGSFLAPFTAGIVSDKIFAVRDAAGTVLHFGYREMFLIAGLMACAGTVLFILTAPKYLGEIGRKPFKKTSEQERTNIFTYKFSKSEKKRILAMGITAVFVILFWTSFYQSFSSITLYARDHVNRNLGNFQVPVPWFAALNSILGIVLAPVIAEIWKKFGSKGFTTPVKMTAGIFSMGTAFALMTLSVISTGGTENGVKAGMIFIVLAYFFNTVSELCIAPIGIAMFNRLAPKRFSTFFMGMWYMTMFVASFISGRVAGYTQNVGFLTIFASLSTILFIMGFILFSIRKYLNKLMMS